MLFACGPKYGPDLEAECANAVGHQACYLTLRDQHNKSFQLYDEQWYGKYIAIDFSAMWCRPCMFAAQHVQEVADSNPDVLYLTVLYETWDFRVPTHEDAALWSDTFGVLEPVLAGSRDMLGSPPEEWEVRYIPTYYLLDRNYIIKDTFTGSNQLELQAKINALVEVDE